MNKVFSRTGVCCGDKTGARTAKVFTVLIVRLSKPYI